MNDDNQALCEVIRELLESAVEPCSEYELIQQLNDRGWTLPTKADDTLQIFNSHFLVFNALYQLQTEYWQHQRFLQISALAVVLHDKAVSEESSQQLSEFSADQALREYYLDWSNLELVTEDSVSDLLDQFWQRFVKAEDEVKALGVLALEPPITFLEVKQRYRSLAMLHHPDRGGDVEQFQLLNWAFGVMQKCLHGDR